MKHLLLAPALLLLVACTQEELATTGDAPTEDACGASGLANLIGQPESVLAAMTFPEGTRILHPDSMVTMDYRPDRLNIHIGANGLIERLDCV